MYVRQKSGGWNKQSQYKSICLLHRHQTWLDKRKGPGSRKDLALERTRLSKKWLQIYSKSWSIIRYLQPIEQTNHGNRVKNFAATYIKLSKAQSQHTKGHALCSVFSAKCQQMLLTDLFLRSNCLHGGILSAVVTYCTRCSNGLSQLNISFFVHSVRKFNSMNFILLVFIVVTNIGQTSILQ